MECRHKGNRSTIPSGRKQKTRHFQKIIGIPQVFPRSRHFFLFRQNKKRMKSSCAVVAVVCFCKEKPELVGSTNEKNFLYGTLLRLSSLRNSPGRFRSAVLSHVPSFSSPAPRRLVFEGSFFPQSHASRYPQTIRGLRCPSGPLLSRHACFQARQKQVMRFSPEERQGEILPIESSAEDFSFFFPVLTGRREFRILKQRTVTL